MWSAGLLDGKFLARFGIFWRDLKLKLLGYFKAIWNI
jgi:hypothetical protein